MCEKKTCFVTKRSEVCVQRRVVLGFELVKVQSFMKNVITSNCAGIDRSRDSNRCVVTILLLVGAGTALFGFIQICEHTVCALQTAEYLHNV